MGGMRKERRQQDAASRVKPEVCFRREGLRFSSSHKPRSNRFRLALKMPAERSLESGKFCRTSAAPEIAPWLLFNRKITKCFFAPIILPLPASADVNVQLWQKFKKLSQLKYITSQYEIRKVKNICASKIYRKWL